MRSKLAALLFLLCWGGAFGQQSQPESKKEKSLAEVATNTRQQKSSFRTPVRLITNADLKSLKSNVSTSQTSKDPSAARDRQKTELEEVAKRPGVTEKEIGELRFQFDEARNNLLIATNQAVVLQLRMNHLRNAYFTRSDGATQERIQYQIVETQQQIEDNKTDQAEARFAIQELQQSARKAGLPRRQIQELTGKLPEEPPEITTPESRG